MFRNFSIQSKTWNRKKAFGFPWPKNWKLSFCLNTDSSPHPACTVTTDYVLPSKSLEQVRKKRKKNIVIWSGKEEDADNLEIMFMQCNAWIHFWWIRSTDFTDWIGSHWTEHAKPQLLIVQLVRINLSYLIVYTSWNSPDKRVHLFCILFAFGGY